MMLMFLMLMVVPIDEPTFRQGRLGFVDNGKDRAQIQTYVRRVGSMRNLPLEGDLEYYYARTIHGAETFFLPFCILRKTGNM